MQTFNVTFPNKNRIAGVSLAVVCWMIVPISSFLWAVHNHNNLAVYFMMTPVIIPIICVLALKSRFKKFLTIEKKIELNQNSIIIKGQEQDEILFTDIHDYEYTTFRGTVGIKIKRINGEVFFINGGTNKKNNIAFIETVNQEMKKLISMGELPLVKKNYASFVETKWGMKIVVWYLLLVCVIFYSLKSLAYFKLIIAINCFTAFIGALAYLLIKERNAGSSWYQREDISS